MDWEKLPFASFGSFVCRLDEHLPVADRDTRCRGRGINCEVHRSVDGSKGELLQGAKKRWVAIGNGRSFKSYLQLLHTLPSVLSF